MKEKMQEKTKAKSDDIVENLIDDLAEKKFTGMFEEALKYSMKNHKKQYFY